MRSIQIHCASAVEQLTRYLELLNQDPQLTPVHGVLGTQEIRPQARMLAMDRGASPSITARCEAVRRIGEEQARYAEDGRYQEGCDILMVLARQQQRDGH